MAAILFSRLERFCEESQGMAAHWSIAQIDNHQSVSHSVRYVCIELLWQLKTWHIHTGSSRRKCKSIGGVRQFGTRTIWHQDSKSGHFGTKKANVQFGIQTIWHRYNETDYLVPSKKYIQIIL